MFIPIQIHSDSRSTQILILFAQEIFGGAFKKRSVKFRRSKQQLESEESEIEELNREQEVEGDISYENIDGENPMEGD
ncbi:hypothetical protein P8452_13415 [Trifolium repens]|nr:hypothetical protein P8452_13415 [Trifolium repens]